MEDASGAWLSVDLVKVPGASRWLGGRPANETDTGPFEYIVQAVDSDANVATATGKGVNFETITPDLNQGVSVTVSDVGDPVMGWYPGRSGTDVVATATSEDQITSYILDGVQTAASGTSIQIPIDGDGGHLLQVFAGSKQGLLFVAIDGTGPVVQAAVQGTEGFAVITITAVDRFGSGVETIYFDRGDGPEVYAGPFSAEFECRHRILGCRFRRESESGRNA